MRENDIVRLKHNVPVNSPRAWPGIPSMDLTTGSLGTVVMVYETNSTDPEYEVEFVDNDGQTLALLSLKEDDIESVSPCLSLSSLRVPLGSEE
jgi:Domain of unknown function (DUF4926)